MDVTVEVTHRGAEVLKCPETMKLVRRDLMVRPFNPQQAFPQAFPVFAETPTKVIVPLHWARTTLGHLTWVDKRPAPTPMHHEFAGALRPELHQPEAVAAVRAAWKATGGAMLCLSCGMGKTTVGLYLACSARCKTLVLVHKEFLAAQWEERIRQFVPTATVTRVQGEACDTSGDFVIAMIQTLVSRKYPAHTFASVGVVLADEVHHIGAQAFSSAMWGLCAPLTLGLTATPQRKDRLDRVVTWFMGDIAFQVKRENQEGTVVKVRTYSTPRYREPPPVNRRGDMCFTSIVTELAADAARTGVIADEAAALARDRDVLVLSHRRGHCTAIVAALAARGVDAATYLGGDKAVPDSRVIVATYALTSEGFDCPRLSALVLATPASDVEQSCGRVMRGSATQSALIVDVVDDWGVCYAQHAKRKAFYKRCGFKLASKAREPSPPPRRQPEFAFVDDTDA
jgi:hypothetical protein